MFVQLPSRSGRKENLKNQYSPEGQNQEPEDAAEGVEEPEIEKGKSTEKGRPEQDDRGGHLLHEKLQSSESNK